MSNAPFSKNLSEEDMAIFKTYAQVQAIVLRSTKKELDDAKTEIERLKYRDKRMRAAFGELRNRMHNHEYEGSERWSPELGDEVYRDGKWVKIERRVTCSQCGHNGAY